MGWMEDVISAFGRRIGIDDLSPNSDGVTCLQLGDIGRLYVERDADDVLVSLACLLPREAEDLGQRALAMCSLKERHPQPVYVGISEDEELVFVARLVEQRFTLPEMEKAIDLLLLLHRRILR